MSDRTTSAIDVAAFYHFKPLPEFESLQQPLLDLCATHGVKGIILLAPEGINGTIAAPGGAMGSVLAGLRALAGIPNLEHKASYAKTMPFARMKVRLKREIVTIGDERADPLKAVGTYVEPEDWNALISQPDVLLLDTRNHFEVRLGTFKGAVDPKTTAFGEFPAYVRANLDPGANTRVAMFCTGGIRCEKASSLLLAEGFKEVFHLKGGILKYLETIPEEESLWEGDCFVFDKRVGLGHGLKITDRTVCDNCSMPLDEAALASPDFERGVCCPACAPGMTPDQKASARERQRQMDLAERKGPARSR